MPEVIFNDIPNGSCIALYSDARSWEPFYLCKVLDMKVAYADCTGSSGHMIPKGKKFISVFYYKKSEKEQNII